MLIRSAALHGWEGDEGRCFFGGTGLF